jgi:hypothetical protein
MVSGILAKVHRTVNSVGSGGAPEHGLLATLGWRND